MLDKPARSSSSCRALWLLITLITNDVGSIIRGADTKSFSHSHCTWFHCFRQARLPVLWSICKKSKKNPNISCLMWYLMKKPGETTRTLMSRRLFWMCQEYFRVSCKLIWLDLDEKVEPFKDSGIHFLHLDLRISVQMLGNSKHAAFIRLKYDPPLASSAVS